MSDNELIESYLLNKLNDREKREFELRLDDDREFARKCRLIKMFPEMMSKEGREEYENNQNPPVEEVKEVKKTGKKHFYISASVIVMLVAIISFYFILNHNNDRTNSESAVDTAKSQSPVQKVSVPVAPRQVVAEKPGTDTPVVSEKRNTSAVFPSGNIMILRKDKISFRWNERSDTFTRFYILSEPGKKVILWRGVKPGITNFDLQENTLFPGKYSWYVGTPVSSCFFTVSDSVR